MEYIIMDITEGARYAETLSSSEDGWNIVYDSYPKAMESMDGRNGTWMVIAIPKVKKSKKKH